MPENERRVVIAAVVIGIGMGGFVDGIVLHQILQLHNMLSARFPPDSVVNLEINMFWDGVFHAFTWLFNATGLFLLWRALHGQVLTLPGRAFVGALLVGWALFNLVEGLVDHNILHLHHVVERAEHPWWDYGFLGASVVLLVLGATMVRRKRPETAG